MAIFPIINGQKPDPTRAIPPRGSTSAAKAQRPKKEDAYEDLIDFGQSSASASSTGGSSPRTSPLPPTDPEDVQGMLKLTGKEAEKGPLVDFASDMKKSIPSTKRSETEESDEFHDAQE